jgi:hypothetical protein
MDKLCKFCWEQTPALSVSYRMQTAIQKSARDRTPLAGAMTSEGNLTIPLCVIGAVLILTAIPTVCVCCCRHRKKQHSPD